LIICFYTTARWCRPMIPRTKSRGSLLCITLILAYSSSGTNVCSVFLGVSA
ncbi:hypothetical protein J6590_103901, partial [Homalodisca vitripennis]